MDYEALWEDVSVLLSQTVKSPRRQGLFISLFDAYFNRRLTRKQASLITTIAQEIRAKKERK